MRRTHWCSRVQRRRIATFVAVISSSAIACSGEAAPSIAKIGSPAPAYAAETMDGKPVPLDSLKGQPVLLNVWATWCKPCREEIPALDSLHREFSPRGLVVAGVSIDVIDDTTRIVEFARDLGASYALWRDPDDRISNVFRAIGVPSSYLIDRDGVLRWTAMGAVHASDAKLRAVLDSVTSQR